ncbi:MAG: putative signal transduction histidine kinase, partial [Acidimicrobiaceae bacterium]
MLRFVLSGLVAVVLVSVITAQVSRNVAVDIAIAEALDRSIDGARRVAEPVLFDSVIDGDPAALARVDEAIRSEMSSTSLVSVNLWTDDGTIVYSTEPRLIGEQFDLHDDQVAIFHGSEPLAEVTDPAAPENRFEADEKLLEVYVLSSTQEGTPLLYEAYYRYSGVTTMGRQISRRFAPVALGAVLVVELVQIPLAIRLARRLRSGQLRHERLIGHAMAASDAERRRIADGLHVGALQELVGSSMSLAAA